LPAHFENLQMTDENHARGTTPAFYNLSVANTFTPRYIAAGLDDLIAICLGAIAAIFLIGEAPVAQTICLVIVYFGYFFAFEATIARTPAKYFAGLIIVRQDGSQASVREAAIRTAFRLIEVNPLFGALPAALCIFFSKHRQRFGDMVAGTLVVMQSNGR
jgi:uncharacterized RDD family membrane protein YckC